MLWMELSLDATSEAVDWVCTLLANTRYQGNIKIVDYAADSSASPSPPWAFTVYFYLPNDARSQAQEIAAALSSLSRTGIATELQMRQVEDTALTLSHNLSNPSAPIQRIGDRFVITTHDAYCPAPHELTLQIKPSLAFGSGLHPATQLSLRLLEKYVTPGMKTLDLGSGTGILSVAIAKLGAQVWAVDNDAIAVQATQESVKNNSVTAQVTVQQGSLGKGNELGHWMGESLEERSDKEDSIDGVAPFDLIVANILARVHITLAPDFRRALNPAGILITAGFTIDYEEAVIAALLEEGFEAIDYERQGEWVAWMYRLNPLPANF
jgi:ribosomal protein L11 methyltransferase